MKKHASRLVLATLLTGSAAFADFAPISDFQNSDLTAFAVGHSPDVSAGGNGGISVVADPFGDSTNKVLKIDVGTFPNGTDINNVWFSVPIGPISAKATIYYRMAWTEDLNDLISGTTPVAPPTAYGDYSSIFRHRNTGVLDFYNNTGYTAVDGVDTSYPVKTWLQVWQVVDQANNSYDVWVKGGTKWTTPTKLVSGAIFRKKGTDPLVRFSARASTGAPTNPSSLEPTYFDDIYVDMTGENITVPGEISGGGDVPDSNSGSVGTGNLVNISTRAFTGPGDQVLTSGFVIPDAPRRVLIRGIGPTLASFGVSGTLADPVVKVYKAGTTTVIYSNDNWGDSALKDEIITRSVQVGAFALLEGSADAVVIATLPAGGYTVQVSGANGGTGVGMVEVYRLP